MPDTFINLISVGQLVKTGIGCNFDDGKVAISTPKPLQAVAYEVCMNGMLFFVDIEFVPASTDVACFAKVPETVDLWHACMYGSHWQESNDQPSKIRYRCLLP